MEITDGNLDFDTGNDGVERIQMIRLVEVAPLLGTVLPAKIYRRNILDAGCLFCFLLNRGKRSIRIRFDKRGQFAGPIFGFGDKAFLNPDEIDQSGFDRPAFYRHFYGIEPLTKRIHPIPAVAGRMPRMKRGLNIAGQLSFRHQVSPENLLTNLDHLTAFAVQ